ncbi:MAG: PAS domain S-box protein [Terriglobia bacterium]
MMDRQKLLQALPAIERYGTAVLAVACTIAIRLVLDPFLGDRAPFLLFLLTIVIVKRLWGRGPGLLATLLGGVAAWYFLIEPRFSFGIADSAEGLNLAAYFAVGAGISFIREGSFRQLPPLSLRGLNIKSRVVRQTAVLAGAAMVLAGMVLLLLRDFERAQDAQAWVVHTYRVINSAESVISTMKDAERGERGYLLTGDERYLAPYNSAIAALPEGLKELGNLTSDNLRQQARLVEINQLTEERLRVLQQAIDLRKASKTDAALSLVRSGQGERAMDKLRTTLDTLVSEEQQLLGERTTEAEVRASRGRWVLGLGSGALVLLLVFASVVIEREAVRREEITQALRRHADLLEQAHDSLFTWPLGGAIDYWSRGAETLYGYTREEAVGRSSHELLRSDHPLGMAHVDAVLERDGQWKGELTQATKDGRKLLIEGQWTLAVDADGNKTVLEANRDITERKRAEEEVRESEAVLRSFFDSPGMMRGMVELVEGRIIHVYCNEAAAQLYGVDRKSIAGKSAKEGGASESVAQLWVALYETARSTDKPVSGEYARLDAAGKERWLLATATYMGVGQSGNPRFAYTILDLTERKRAEEALKESEARLRTLGDNLPEGAIYRYRLDADGRHHVDFISEGIERLTGEPAAEFMADPTTVIRHVEPEDRERLTAAIAFSAEHLTQFEVEIRHKHQVSGEPRWSLLRSSPTRLPDGSTTWDGIEIDITRRKQAEAQNLLLATAIEQAAETVVITDRDAKIQYVNPAFFRTTGYCRDEAIGGNPRVLKSGQQDARFYKEMWATLAAGKLWRGEFTNRRKDGALYQEEATIAPVRNASGETTNYIAIKSDITERKQAELALRESERTLRLFVRHAPAAIAMLDREMCYLVVSQRWMADYRLGDRDLQGLSHYEVFPEVPEGWREIHQRCLAGAVERCEEESFSRPDGSSDWLSWEVRPWRKMDESIGGIIIFSELITERKQAEEKVRQLNLELEERVRSRTAALESANRELEAFAHSVSHDLRAPLRGIDGWSQALLEDYGERLDAQAHQYLGRVRSEAQRMGMLIDDLLHLSRVGRTELVPTPVDLTALAETLVARLREANANRNIDFILAPNLKCIGDARLLEIALTNLLSNAVKFTGPRNRARVEFGRTQDQGSPAYFVRDNGVGFDMAYAKMLFAPFQRLHKTSEFPGTGIGLATVQRVVHRHGGRVWAEARVGEGATIYFTLGAHKS